MSLLIIKYLQSAPPLARRMLHLSCGGLSRWHSQSKTLSPRNGRMSPLILAFIAVTVTYSILWHNQSNRAEDEGESDVRLQAASKARVSKPTPCSKHA